MGRTVAASEPSSTPLAQLFHNSAGGPLQLRARHHLSDHEVAKKTSDCFENCFWPKDVAKIEVGFSFKSPFLRENHFRTRAAM